jgi:hypothetical protein
MQKAIAVVVLLICVACSSDTHELIVGSTTVVATFNWSANTLATNVVTLEEPGAEPYKQLDLIRDLGIEAIRLPVRWSDIEPQQGKFEWSKIDELIRGASARGLAVLGVLTWAPAWAVPEAVRNTPHPAPRSADEFAEFAGMAAKRFSREVTAWEVWNEPNVAATFGPNVNIDMYCAMLRGAHTSIKAANNGAIVVTGPTSPATDSRNGISPATFVNALYECAPDSFDAIGMHPYSAPDLLSRPRSGWSSAADITKVGQVMDLRGDTARRVWFTEFGAPTTSIGPGVSEARQAEIIADGVTLLRSLPRGGPVFVFDLRDLDSANSLPDYRYGMVRSDFSRKPSLDAFLSLRR